MQFNQIDYELFRDYKDVMRQVFNLTCSWCGEGEITYVRKNYPPLIGDVVKALKHQLSDQELENYLKEPIKAWQVFDDNNVDHDYPTYLCDQCYNSCLQ
ncbi:hypothetical protein LD125_00385 [Mesoplasma sp. JKS002658]|uniref:hypothetical protein n=1 Tax=Mesoplasma whartonense TaxID=2878854 RepID=UPI0020229CB4|nr:MULTISPECIES: hypothetical protein [unclassified Mesoplasma]MCL8211111.1 hypothetical protein [Mesoplasma sp. JKS002664]MCL8211772.1 hypothetical protein [Mesoplasma sp. JKS002662]MCL8214123.1 hypothetical protein [Mesoplasma sp. JKS002658]MCL8214449.1 hypothetical protein [Mesoplasma sp. JKS002663]MCL8215442.1 hypothetical protein [Mesoplasma sp. JKS002659]